MDDLVVITHLADLTSHRGGLLLHLQGMLLTETGPEGPSHSPSGSMSLIVMAILAPGLQSWVLGEACLLLYTDSFDKTPTAIERSSLGFTRP